LQLHHPLQQVVPHQLLEVVMGSLLNFELDDEQQVLLYLQALLHILKISSSSSSMLIFCWLCKTFLPPLADYLGLLYVQVESLQIIQEKNEKVVIPMHQEA
jgi:hypothetical protein